MRLGWAAINGERPGSWTGSVYAASDVFDGRRPYLAIVTNVPSLCHVPASLACENGDTNWARRVAAFPVTYAEVSSVKETIEQAVDTIAVWGLYLLFYTVIVGALILGAYAMAQQIVLGG